MSKVRTIIIDYSEEVIKLANELIRLDDWFNREVMLKRALQDQNCKFYVAEVDGNLV